MGRPQQQTDVVRTLIMIAALLALYLLILRWDVVIQLGHDITLLWTR